MQPDFSALFRKTEVAPLSFTVRPEGDTNFTNAQTFPMLNLSFLFEDAIRSVENFGHALEIAPLPATVFLMQQDVVNHYAYALDHYFPLGLQEPFLQESSFGTPYQKWAKFTNDHFALLDFAVQNLVRYTARLLDASEVLALMKARNFSAAKDRGSAYISLVCALRSEASFVGVKVHEDESLTVNRLEPQGERTRNYTLPSLVSDKYDIADRNAIKTLGVHARRELDGLRKLHALFKQACLAYYAHQSPLENFDRLIADYTI